VKIGLGRVIKAEALADAEPIHIEHDEKTLPRGQVVASAVLDANDRALSLLQAAEGRAAAIVAEAERAAAELRLRAESEGRANASASIAARAIALKQHEARADERALSRSVELARLLAERLLGESLRVAPEQITSLAQKALGEARGARKIVVVAHPEDAQILAISLPALGLDAGTTSVRADASRTRGNLRIETEIGVLDAELAPQLERLALKLRESLSHD